NAIWAVPAREVVVLPNDPDVLMAAAAAAAPAREAGLVVAVVPSRAVVQGLAAVAVLGPVGEVDAVVPAMTQAAAASVYAEVSVAARDVRTSAGPCRAGQVLGLLDSQIVLIDDDPDRAATRLLARLGTGQTELLTLISGAEVSAPGRAGMQQVVAAIER